MNYQLNQWEAGDQVLREEFNADNAKIDAALGEAARIVTGTYTGNGNSSQTISLGFTPKAVYVCTSFGATYHRNSPSFYYGGMALEGHPLKSESTSNSTPSYSIVTIVEGGFKVYHGWYSGVAGIYSNNENVVYHYLALR